MFNGIPLTSPGTSMWAMKINGLSAKQEVSPQKHKIINMQCKVLHCLQFRDVGGDIIKHGVRSLLGNNLTISI